MWKTINACCGAFTRSAAITLAIGAAALFSAGSVQAQTAGAADLSVEKFDANDPMPSGGQQTYTIIVFNNGPETAYGTVVNDSLPSGANFVSVSSTAFDDPEGNVSQMNGVVNAYVGRMEPGTSETITIVAELNGNGQVINTATVRAESGCDPDPTNNFGSATTTLTEGGTGPGADLEITKNDDPDPVTVDGLLEYTVTVVNTGPANAENVVITDKLPTGAQYVSATSSTGAAITVQDGIVTANVGTLLVGQTSVLTIRIRPQTAGLIVNAASARSSTQQSGPLSDNTVLEFTTVTGGPVCACCADQPPVDLALTKSDAPDPVIVDTPLTYTVTVNNQGDTTATGVLMQDVLPEGVTFVSSDVQTTGSCDRNGRVLSCSLGRMGPGETRVITIEVIPNETGTIINTAGVQANEPDLNTANNSESESTTVLPNPDVFADLSISKTARETTVSAGQNLTYDIVVTNEGPDAAEDVIVTDTYPSGATFVSSTPSQGTCSRSGNVVTCRLGTLQPSTSATIVLVLQPNSPGTFVNNVTVRSDATDTDQTDNVDSESTEVFPSSGCPDLTGMFKMTPIAKCKTNRRGVDKCKIFIWFVVQNMGDVKSQNTKVTFYLSEDPILDEGDMRLRTLRVKALRPGGMKQFDPKFKVKQNVIGMYIIADIDPDNKVQECNEQNNEIVGGPIFPAELR